MIVLVYLIVKGLRMIVLVYMIVLLRELLFFEWCIPTSAFIQLNDLTFTHNIFCFAQLRACAH